MDEEWLNDESEVQKRRSSHIRSCSVEGCTSKGYRLLIEGERVQYFPFPQFDPELCRRWLVACKLSPTASLDKAFVCSKHFRANDYKARGNSDKKILRRSAIPSFEAVASTGKTYSTPKKKKVSDSETSTDAGSDIGDDEDKLKQRQVTTLVQKEGLDGDRISVVLVNNPRDKVPPPRLNPFDNVEKPQVLSEAKKVPLLLTDLLALGPPYPWRRQGLEEWTNERLDAHEMQLNKIGESVNEESEKIAILQEQIDARKEVLALAIIKKTMGRMVLSQYLRSLS